MTHKKEEFIDEWLSPTDAARLMSRRAGYVIIPDDLKQLRRRKKLTRFKKLNDRISLYYREEIQRVPPPRKRNPQPFIEA